MYISGLLCIFGLHAWALDASEAANVQAENLFILYCLLLPRFQGTYHKHQGFAEHWQATITTKKYEASHLSFYWMSNSASLEAVKGFPISLARAFLTWQIPTENIGPKSVISMSHKHWPPVLHRFPKIEVAWKKFLQFLSQVWFPITWFRLDSSGEVASKLM